jgi:hypothetical protein
MAKKESIDEKVAKAVAAQLANGTPPSRHSVADDIVKLFEDHPRVLHIWQEDEHEGPLGGLSCQVALAFEDNKGQILGVSLNVYEGGRITNQVLQLIDTTVEEVKADAKRRKSLGKLNGVTKLQGQKLTRALYNEGEARW